MSISRGISFIHSSYVDIFSVYSRMALQEPERSIKMLQENREEPEKRLKYAVYTIRSRLDDGMVYARFFIVLKNGYGVIHRFTRLQEYAGVYQNRTYRPLTSNPEAKLYFICGMLNYILVENGGRFGIRHVFDITKPMLEEYFDHYGMMELPDGGHHTKESVERCIAAVTAFMENLSRKFGGYMKLSKADLYVEKTIHNCRGRLETTWTPAFQAVGIFDEEETFREMPAKVMEILLPMAFKYTRDIAFGIALQAFAGLRAGEVCNVRRERSPLGAGIRFVEIGGTVRRIEIDLRKELTLRSDGAEVGGIKKERLQGVYPAFIGAFLKAYEMHREYLAKMPFEEEYAPMFINTNGMAMSYETYRGRFKTLINEYLRPYLIRCGDPELRIYGQLLYENRLGTHALRHWFTVQLVLRGEDIANIQFWRGDRNPESAFTYLQNKGDLIRELKETNERLLESLIRVGGEIVGG